MAALHVLPDVRSYEWVQFSYLAITPLYFCSGATRRELGLTILAGIVLTGAVGFAGSFVYPGGHLVTAGAYLGVAGTLALAWRAPRDVHARVMLARCLALIGGGVAVHELLGLNARFAVWKLDLYLYALDLKLTGTAPAFLVGANAIYSYLRPAELLLYYSLPFITMLVYAGHLRHSRPAGTNFLLIAITNMVIGYSLYLSYPAAGPAYAFPGLFPRHMPIAAAVHPVLIAAPANCMPSLHVAAALLIWWNCRHWRVVPYFALAFLALTVLATLGLGEHYCVDLVVAVPYALFIQGLGTRAKSRFQCLLVGSITTVAWLVSLRYGFWFLMGHAWLLRLMALATIGIPMWLAIRLLGPACHPGRPGAGGPAPCVATGASELEAGWAGPVYR